MTLTMNTNLRLLSLAALFSALNMASAGDVTGKITLKGTPPPEKALPLDAMCGKLQPNGAKTRFYVADASGNLADVVVTIKGFSGKSTGESAPGALIDQVGCVYTPTISTIQTKQKLSVRTSDPMMHNVHVMPVEAGNKESNKAQMPKSPDLTYTFEAPEEFLKFKCDVHPWMFAWVTVTDHPYVTVSAADGTFKIANVPPGKYKIEAAHRKGGKVSQDIEVTAGGAKADFTIEAK